ncbi:DUF397 domain-containing protein [Labedaea rhizosphaerae]|uniref:Uncharacterized protein DUF397 n=1 Tax=Labedaea rhizosphaerae TaxID=598644 RepID=A0A4R6SN12_LABRH|nr:DUF397 domain-containing protein [Labedaea rhizosphaerae]TDQ04573.1 uncharacterized protein DUF397 [Labedaea rhizosphaerae]
MTRTWRTSSHSGNVNCVQVSLTTADALVRDSKNTSGPSLRFTPKAWRALVTRMP